MNLLPMIYVDKLLNHTLRIKEFTPVLTKGARLKRPSTYPLRGISISCSSLHTLASILNQGLARHASTLQCVPLIVPLGAAPQPSLRSAAPAPQLLHHHPLSHLQLPLMLQTTTIVVIL